MPKAKSKQKPKEVKKPAKPAVAVAAGPVAGPLPKVAVSEKELIKKLASTNIALQTKMVELVASTNKLNHRMERILTLFEEASRHVTEVETTEAKIASLATKLETLLEQNKTIARGLLLLEKYVKGKVGLETTTAPRPKRVEEYGPSR